MTTAVFLGFLFSGLTVQRTWLMRNTVLLNVVKGPTQAPQVIQVCLVFLPSDHRMTLGYLLAMILAVMPAIYVMLNTPWKTITHQKTMKQH